MRTTTPKEEEGKGRQRSGYHGGGYMVTVNERRQTGRRTLVHSYRMELKQGDFGFSGP